MYKRSIECLLLTSDYTRNRDFKSMQQLYYFSHSLQADTATKVMNTPLIVATNYVLGLNEKYYLHGVIL